ncbi:MAG: ATP-binding cassette domain-containing protein [Bacteroidia bacterium]|nr:ATP-binding cassette domain-containing protein [Bacteroidia bacterium]
MLSSQSLVFSYPEGQSFHFPDILCEKGQSLLVLGESGKGKTTFLHLLAGLLIPQSGEVRVGDTSIFSLKSGARDTFRGRNIGIVFQRAHFITALSVRDNLLMAQYLAKKPQDPRVAETLLNRLGLEHKSTARPHRLSQGEQQRVAIARALINHPAVILADEPTSALDDRNSAAVADLLEAQASQAGAALVIVTHDVRLKNRFPNQVIL